MPGSSRQGFPAGEGWDRMLSSSSLGTLPVPSGEPLCQAKCKGMMLPSHLWAVRGHHTGCSLL